MEEVRALSREIVFLLTAAELDFLESKDLVQFASHPVKSLIQTLFHGLRPNDMENNRILEVSHARLRHLRWSRDLAKAFRHWGRDASLKPVETCELGHWIHAIGFKRGIAIEEIKLLDKKHKLFHSQAEKTIRALRSKKGRRAEEAYTKVVQLSREVIYLLSRIELRFLDTGDTTSPVNVFE